MRAMLAVAFISMAILSLTATESHAIRSGSCGPPAPRGDVIILLPEDKGEFDSHLLESLQVPNPLYPPYIKFGNIEYNTKTLESEVLNAISTDNVGAVVVIAHDESVAAAIQAVHHTQDGREMPVVILHAGQGAEEIRLDDNAMLMRSVSMDALGSNGMHYLMMWWDKRASESE